MIMHSTLNPKNHEQALWLDDCDLSWEQGPRMLIPVLGKRDESDCDHMSSNSVRRVKSVVEKEIWKSFELRDCRRAYGQFYINKGLELEDVSVLMGHGTTKTTELYYCRKRESVVIEKAKDLW